MNLALTTCEHRCDNLGRRYVYCVRSRRVGGLSVGINLNPNRACNWDCLYCQVPDRVFGTAPAIDLELLGKEVRAVLAELAPSEDWPKNLTLSGDGEPTTSRQFADVIELLASILDENRLRSQVSLLVITNGSMMHRPEVQSGLARLAEGPGEVWFKIDRATTVGVRLVNGVRWNRRRTIDQLRRAVGACPTWIQTCWFGVDGNPPPANEVEEYLHLLGDVARRQIAVQGIHLYGIARPSHHAQADRISPVTKSWLATLSDQVQALGYSVRVA